MRHCEVRGLDIRQPREAWRGTLWSRVLEARQATNKSYPWQRDVTRYSRGAYERTRDRIRDSSDSSMASNSRRTQ
eukprot:2129883-Pyramimonas_sp.AAC.1